MAHSYLCRPAWLSCLTLAWVPLCGWAQTVAVTIGSNYDFARQFSVTGTGCAPGVVYTTPATLQWTPGASCTVTFESPQSLTLERRYHFLTWNDGVASNPRVFTAPSQSATYIPLFNTEYRITVQISPPGAGTVTAPEWAFPDTRPSLVATPAAGYRLVRWSGADEQLGATATVRMSSYARTVTAHFAAASTALSTAYTAIPVLNAVYQPPLLNDYGQVSQSSYGSTSDLWTPQPANSLSGSVAAVDVPFGRAINSRGQILGASGHMTSLWSPATPNAGTGSTTLMEMPGNAADLNDHGEIGGEGYLWIPATAGGSTGTVVQNARFNGLKGINNYGQAVMLSSAYTGGKHVTVVTLFTPSIARTGTGTFTDLPAPAGGFYSVAAINNAGAIAGTVCAGASCGDQRLFVWRPSAANGTTGTLTVISPPAGFSSMSPKAMNDRGDVVGTMVLTGSDSYNGSVPFLYSGGTVFDLTTGETAFSNATEITINNSGQIAFLSGNFVWLANPSAANPAPPSNAVPVTMQSSDYGRVFSVFGAGCQPGTYGTPRTLLWTPGASCTVTFATPHSVSSDRRLVFLTWQDGVASNPRVFATPAQASTLTANFNTQYRVDARIIPDGAGTVSGTGWITQNGSATLKATPAAGYRFMEWIHSYTTSTSDTIEVSTYNSQTVTAVFAPASTIPPRQYAVIPVSAGSYSWRTSSINDYGQITGGPPSGPAAFLWTPSSANGIAGTLSSLATVTGMSSPASLRINSRGQIAGIRSDSRPFIWSPASPNTTAGTATALSNIGLEPPRAMNDYGQAAGVKWVWTPSEANGATGTLVQNDTWAGVTGINNAGQMLVATASGWRLFTPASRGASTGTYTPIGGPAGMHYMMAAVNASGKVAGDVCVSGTYEYSCVRRAFVSDPGAGASSFTEIAPPAGISSMTALAMNDQGDVVGRMQPSTGSAVPFLYSNGAVYDLSALNAVLRGGTADAINNAGQIVVLTSTGLYLVSPIGAVTPPPAQATLTLSHSELRYGTTAGSAANGQQQVQVTLTGTNAASTAWSAASNQNWLTVTPAAGTGSGQFLMTLAGASTTLPGTLQGTITVTAGSATRTLRVYLTIAPAAATTPPFGFVDLPENYSNVSGAVGVTGWALDDIEVASVEVWRKSVPGEPHLNGQVFVGNGIFLDGARPDIANKNPLLPFNTRAGWGMQILTNMLPNATGTGLRGNGQHQLFVYAVDREGKRTLLGSPVINVNNAAAVKPFGTLDTPASGGTAEGAQYTVWGWALTPQPAAIPTDGSTMWVFVDGVSVAHPVYTLYRPDVSALFPGLQNSSAPVGYYYLDTTKLTNGMHSIAWSVTDNLGRIEGIGSRLFFVQNAGATAASDAKPVKSMRSAEREGIWFRTGYNPDTRLQQLDDNVIRIPQSGRIEVHVSGAASVEFNGNANLPTGSTFDNGVFYWQLDAAFIAAYELKFRDADGNEMGRVAVQVN